MAAELVADRFEPLAPIAGLFGPHQTASKARDIVDGKIVALYQFAAAQEVPQQETFTAELLATRSLVHKNISGIEHAEIRGLTLVVASEYVNGITLSERIRRVAPFTYAVATEIALGAAQGLRAAESAGYNHGALTADDIVVSSDGRVKVAGTGWVFRARRFCGDVVGRLEAGNRSDIAAIGSLLMSMLVDSPQGSTNGCFPNDLPNSAEQLPSSVLGIVNRCTAAPGSVPYVNYADLIADLMRLRDCIKLGKTLDWMPISGAAGRTMPNAAVSLASPITAMAPPLRERAIRNEVNETPTISENAKQKRSLTDAIPVPAMAQASNVDERDPTRVLGLAIKILLVLGLPVIALGIYFGAQMFAVPQDITVPNFVGKTYDEAVRISRQQNFQVNEGASDYNSSWPENQVYKQEPVAGSTIKPNRVVTLWKSKGPRTVQMPDLVAATQARALKELQNASLADATPSQEFSDTVPKDIVISQQPPANTEVMRNAPISFVVSKGKEPPDVPTNLDAQPVGPKQVILKWNPSSRATSYSVTRTQDGDTKVLAEGLKDNQYKDTNLDANTSYSYTVSASNVSGPSGPSDTALVITPAEVTTQPVMGDNVKVAPLSGGANLAAGAGAGSATDTTSPTTSASTSPAEMRQFVIRFRVPRRPRGSHRVKFQVQDATGSTLAYDEEHQSGDRIAEPITAFGNKITFRIFLDSKLVKQQTK